MDFILSRLRGELDDLEKLSLTRVLQPRAGIDFCSNDYLGLSKHTDIMRAVLACLHDDGYGATSSRYIRGEHPLYEVVQNKLSHFAGFDAALLFSCGYMANIGALSSLIKKHDMVFSDQLNHASIIDGLRLSGASINIFQHNNVDGLQEIIKATSNSQQKFLITESLFSMDGDIAPLDIYADLCRKHNIALIVDESHAIGVYGKHGAGLIDHFGVSQDILVSINGLGKAFGTYGGFVAGKETAIDYLTQKARSLMFTTALPPIALAAIDAALMILSQGELMPQLWKNIRYFQRGLQELNLMPEGPPRGPIFPVIIGDNKRAQFISQALSNAGFDVRAIRPPTVPEGSARLRITIRREHSQGDMDGLLCYLKGLVGLESSNIARACRAKPNSTNTTTKQSTNNTTSHISHHNLPPF